MPVGGVVAGTTSDGRALRAQMQTISFPGYKSSVCVCARFHTFVLEGETCASYIVSATLNDEAVVALLCRDRIGQ